MELYTFNIEAPVTDKSKPFYYANRESLVFRSPIKYTFYIDFEDNILQCEIIYKKVDREGNSKPSYFLFVHPKTTPLKDVKREIVYSQTSSPLPNYRRKLTKATSNIERKIQTFFAKDKVFYSDNETGEIMRNYLMWCKG